MDCLVLLLAVGFGAGYLANQSEWWELVAFLTGKITHLIYAYADWIDEETFGYGDELTETYYEYNTWLVQHHLHN